MIPRTAVLIALLLAPLVAGCAADGDEGGGGGRARNATNPNPAATGIGPNAGVGAAPRDMAGGGRGSATPRGK